jgi:hypothetical protein
MRGGGASGFCPDLSRTWHQQVYFTMGADLCGVAPSESIHWLTAEVHSSGLPRRRFQSA